MADPTRAVLWDLDGTLVDSEEFHWQAWQETMAAEGVPITHGQFLATFGRRNASFLPEWLGADASEREIARVGDAKEAAYRRLLRAAGCPAIPGAVEWVRRLHGEARLQALASSAPRANVDVVLEALDLAGCFQAVVAAEDVTVGKPDPQVFLTAAARLGVPPEHCTVVEDAEAGVEAARRAGMRSIGLCRNGKRLGADVVIKGFHELVLDKI